MIDLKRTIRNYIDSAFTLHDLLIEDTAQLFFGEVLSYHPNKETQSISVSPIAAIRGNVKEGTKQNYRNPNAMGGFKITEGKVYLFAYYENADYIDVFEVITYSTRTLKLKHVEGAMWDRFEQYINQGKYGKAKVEGKYRIGKEIMDFRGPGNFDKAVYYAEFVID